jgi:hypothetical protein
MNEFNWFLSTDFRNYSTQRIYLQIYGFNEFTNSKKRTNNWNNTYRKKRVNVERQRFKKAKLTRFVNFVAH